MLKKAKTEFLVVIGTIFGLIILSAVLIIWLPVLQVLRIVFGAVFMLFLPGFFIIELAFPRLKASAEQLDWIERITLSFALSIAVVPLIVYFTNKAGVVISAFNIFLEIASFIIILGITIIVTKSRKKDYTKGTA